MLNPPSPLLILALSTSSGVPPIFLTRTFLVSLLPTERLSKFRRGGVISTTVVTPIPTSRTESGLSGELLWTITKAAFTPALPGLKRTDVTIESPCCRGLNGPTGPTIRYSAVSAPLKRRLSTEMGVVPGLINFSALD
jgi:hypothetical protein